MRQVTRYPEDLKESILARILAPNGPSRVQLAKELNIPYGTIHTWVKMSKNKALNNNKQVIASQRPIDTSAEAKLRAVFDTMGKTELERGAYCREHGFHTNHIDDWQAQILDGLNAVKNKKQKTEHQEITNENIKLKKEILRKDKALAEVSALLILKKKADLLWGVGEDD
jgi:transposase